MCGVSRNDYRTTCFYSKGNEFPQHHNIEIRKVFYTLPASVTIKRSWLQNEIDVNYSYKILRPWRQYFVQRLSKVYFKHICLRITAFRQMLAPDCLKALYQGPQRLSGWIRTMAPPSCNLGRTHGRTSQRDHLRQLVRPLLPTAT